MSASRLERRVAIVTGAGGGLGGGICYVLALAGAAVATVDVERDKAERVAESVARNGTRCVALEVDVSDKRSVEAMTKQVASELGGIDVLVNNAAIYPSRPWTEIKEGEWDDVLAVSLKGYFLCARAAFPYMRERGWGRVINVASITFFIGFANLLDYVSSNGGRRLYANPGARGRAGGVTVNAFSPGAFPTDAEKIHPDPEGYNRWVLDQQSIKRRGGIGIDPLSRTDQG